jgi:hypothetical protein
LTTDKTFDHKKRKNAVEKTTEKANEDAWLIPCSGGLDHGARRA